MLLFLQLLFVLLFPISHVVFPMLPAVFLCFSAPIPLCFSYSMWVFLPFFVVYTNYLLLLGFVVVWVLRLPIPRPVVGAFSPPPCSRTPNCRWKGFASSAIKMHPGLLIGKGKCNMWLTQTFTGPTNAGLRNGRGNHIVLKT